MKKIFTLLSVTFFALVVWSQNPAFNRGTRGGQMPTGRCYGKVIDATGKGLDATSVTLVSKRMDSATKTVKETIVGGMLSDKNGDFSIEGVPVFGRYQIKITGIGIKPLQKPVAFDLPNRDQMKSGDPSAMMGALDKDLGNLQVQPDENVMGAITVTASKPALTLGIDRKIFNVEKNITSAGGTAVDVMKNVPSVNVDIDGNITLRNTAPTIFVDGRPTTMTLDQIPADNIESVEVITNPSAKFDASGGTAGILNIVLKKNKRVGYSGNVRANVDSRGMIGGGGDANLRQNKVNLFAGGMLMNRKSIGTGTTERTTLGQPDTSASKQFDKTIGRGQFGFGRFGIDYFMDIRNTITASVNFGGGKMSPEATSDIYLDYLKGSVPQSKEYQLRSSNSDRIFHHQSAQLSYKHNFPQSGHELTADATYNSSRNENNGSIVTDYYEMPGSVYKYRYFQNQFGLGNNENLTLQTDYAKPLSANSKIEAGARVNMRTSESRNTITIAGRDSLTLYNSTDNVYAAYATFSNRIKNFGYQLGLRAESSEYNGNLLNKGQTFKTSFPVSFFPSLFLSQKVGESDELQFNYSRRINRPNIWQLFPFTDYSDSMNISRGNPGLQPEFTNSVELSFSKVFQNRDNLLVSAYFKNTNKLITQIQSSEYDAFLGKEILVNTFQNANRSYITGLEVIGKNKITKFWDLTTNLNLFTAKIDLEDLPDPDQMLSYFVKINNSFKLPSNFSLQLSGDYQSKTISSPGGRGTGGGGGFGGGRGGFFGGSQSSAQGFIRDNYGVDAALRFDFLKNKTASLSLNVNDVFRTRKYSQHTETGYVIQDAMRRQDAQVFRLNLNYRFGKMDASLFKRKNTKADNNVDMGGQNF